MKGNIPIFCPFYVSKLKKYQYYIHLEDFKAQK